MDKRTYIGIVLILGMFDNDIKCAGRAMLNLNFALSAGSSKAGNARRQSVGWNCVVASHLQKTKKKQIQKRKKKKSCGSVTHTCRRALALPRLIVEAVRAAVETLQIFIQDALILDIQSIL